MELPQQRFSITLILACLMLSQPAENHDGRPLFHKMQTALGGADKIAAVRDYEELEKAETWLENGTSRGEVRKRMRFIRPSYLRIDQVGPGDTYVLFCDGEHGWEILPDKPGVQELTGGELRFAQGYINGLMLNAWLNDRDPDIILTSPSENTIAVAVKGDSKHINEMILDPVTFLPTMGKGISLADPDHPVSSETQFSDWKPSSGIMFPHKITNIHGGKRLAEITVEQIKLNGGLTLSELKSKPPDMKPVMSH